MTMDFITFDPVHIERSHPDGFLVTVVNIITDRGKSMIVTDWRDS